MRNEICTSECVHCKYGTLNNSNKAKVKIYCNIRNKEYYYGQIMPCDDYDFEKEEINGQENN